jgi:hypothetical protein
VAIDVQVQVVIRRPRTEVAAFMFESRNDRVWTANVIESRPLTEGPLRKGSRVQRVVRFLARRLVYTYEVLDADPAAFVELRVTRPFPMEVRYELSDVARGTLTRIRARGNARGFFRVREAWLARSVKGAIARDLQALKGHLEGSGIQTRPSS